MPWDGTELWIGKLSREGAVIEQRKIAGGIEESICQPQWSPDGILHFVSDRTGWWNLYRWRDNQAEALCPLAAEFGQPQWVFGGSLYGFASEKQIICSYSKNGTDYLATLDTATRVLARLAFPSRRSHNCESPPTAWFSLAHLRRRRVPLSHWIFRRKDFEVLRRSRETAVDAGYLSEARAVEFPTEQGLTAHGYFYPPRNRDYAAPARRKAAALGHEPRRPDFIELRFA